MAGANRILWSVMIAVMAAAIALGTWTALGNATRALESSAAPVGVSVANSGDSSEASVLWNGTEGAKGNSMRGARQDAARYARYASQDWEGLMPSASVPAGGTSLAPGIGNPGNRNGPAPHQGGGGNSGSGEPNCSLWRFLLALGLCLQDTQVAPAALAITQNSTALAHEPGPTTGEMTDEDLRSYGQAAARNAATLERQVILLGWNAHPDRITNIRDLTGRLSSNAERVEGGRAALVEAIEAWRGSEWQLTGANSQVLFRTAATVTGGQFHRLMGGGKPENAAPDREDALRYSHWTNLSSDLMLAHALLDMASLLDDPKPLARVREEYDSAADRIRQDMEYLKDNSRTELELDLLVLAKPVLRAGSGENNYFDLLERMLKLQAAERALLDDSAEALELLTEEIKALVENPWQKPSSETVSVPEGQEPGVSAEEILFGQSAALTRPSGALGRGMKLGIETAFAEANRNGGVHGRQVKLLSVNDRYEPDSAAAATQYLLDDRQVFALIGAVGTPTSRAAVPLAEAAGAPFIGPFTGAQFLRNPNSITSST